MGWQVVYVPFLFAGNTIINQQGVYVYSSTPTLGDLIASIVSVAGTDQFGNPVQAGLTDYVTIAGTTYAIGLNSLSGTGLPGLSMGDINNPPTAVAGFFGEASSNVSTPQAFAAVTSGQANASDVASFISILSQVQSSVTGGQIVLQAGIVQIDDAGNIANFTVDNSQILRYIDNANNQGWSVGESIKQLSGTAQSINSVTPVVITLSGISLQWNVVAGEFYYFKIFVVYAGAGAVGTPVIGVDGGATLVSLNSVAQWLGNGAVFQSSGSGYVLGTFTNLTGPTLNTGNNALVWEGTFQCSASGTFNFRAQEGTAGDAWTIKGGFGILEPV